MRVSEPFDVIWNLPDYLLGQPKGVIGKALRYLYRVLIACCALSIFLIQLYQFFR